MLAVLFITHFVMDGLLQSREMAKKKSEEWFWISSHVWIIFLGFGSVLFFCGYTKEAFYFSLLNAIIHGLIDWNIWRFYKRGVMKRIPFRERKDFKWWEDGKFFDTIMLDQLLHYLTILLLWQWLT